MFLQKSAALKDNVCRLLQCSASPEYKPLLANCNPMCQQGRAEEVQEEEEAKEEEEEGRGRRRRRRKKKKESPTASQPIWRMMCRPSCKSPPSMLADPSPNFFTISKKISNSTMEVASLKRDSPSMRTTTLSNPPPGDNQTDTAQI